MTKEQEKKALDAFKNDLLDKIKGKATPLVKKENETFKYQGKQIIKDELIDELKSIENYQLKSYYNRRFLDVKKEFSSHLQSNDMGPATYIFNAVNIHPELFILLNGKRTKYCIDYNQFESEKRDALSNGFKFLPNCNHPCCSLNKGFERTTLCGNLDITMYDIHYCPSCAAVIDYEHYLVRLNNTESILVKFNNKGEIISRKKDFLNLDLQEEFSIRFNNINNLPDCSKYYPNAYIKSMIALLETCPEQIIK